MTLPPAPPRSSAPQPAGSIGGPQNGPKAADLHLKTATVRKKGILGERGRSLPSDIGATSEEGVKTELPDGTRTAVTTPPLLTRAATLRQTPVNTAPPFPDRSFARFFAPRAWARLRIVTDFLVLYIAASAALFAAPVKGTAAESYVLAATFPLLTMAILHARRPPGELLGASVLDNWAHVLGAVSLASMLTIAANAILGGEHPVALALRLWLFAFAYLGGSRMVLLSVRRNAIRSERVATPTLVVGAGHIGEHLVRRLASDSRYGLRPVGFLDSDPLPRTGQEVLSVPILGGPGDLGQAVARTGASRVILAFSSRPDWKLVETVEECQTLGVDVSLVPRLYEAINEQTSLDHVGGVPLLSLHPTNPRGWQFAVKHTLDRTVALLALACLSPFLTLIAITVRLSSPGPILFRQRRVGRDGQVFDLLKFRTMYVPQMDSNWTPLDGLAPGGVEGLDRRTRFGRFLRDSSLDELPQLVNVLRGEMSLVGPRPERPEFVEQFTVQVARYQNRHRVMSGITGWAQVNGLRGQTSIDDRVEWDNYYIRNWSLWLDARIIALTVAEVLRFRG
jgi:exopolysaccharide biosynthesis polyprenyl glycosylphosphotransferase